MMVSRYILPLLIIISAIALKEVTGSTRKTTVGYVTRGTTNTRKQECQPVTKYAAKAAPVSTTCPLPKCRPCPSGYQIYYEYQYSCQYRCLCEMSFQTTSASISKSLLLSILQNIQNNAKALEQMATGLSDEADLAQEAAALPYR